MSKADEIFVKNMKKVLGALLLLAVLASTALAAPRTVTLVLLRHGESEWNLEKKFTGWSDIRLTRKGVKQAFDAGILLAVDEVKAVAA